MKNFKIRQETKEDLDEVYQLIKTAFETAKVKDGDEQDFAVKLREGKNFIPELSMVAETDGKLIGQDTISYDKLKALRFYKAMANDIQHYW